MAIRQVRVGPGELRVSNVGEALPEASVDTKSTTSWGGSWSSLGYTSGGIQVRFSTTQADITVDQELDPMNIVVTGRDCRVSTSLAETTIENIVAAIGYGTVEAKTASNGTTQYDRVVLDGGTPLLNEKQVGFQANTKDGKPYRIFLFRAIATAQVEQSFTKDSLTVTPVEFRGLPYEDLADTAHPVKVCEIQKVK